jgi:septal ring-binding cell division protein DamX
VSATETPAPPAPVERRCPHCGAHLSAEQEWCLDCGSAVGTRIAQPRGWRVPLAVVGSLLALALIALVLVIVELSSPAEKIVAVPQTPTPGAAATPAPQTTPPPEEGGAAPTPSATPAPESAAPTANLATWPQGKTAWTIVLNSSGTRDDAERLASELATKGVPAVGVIDSNDFESLGPDSFVIFSGQYASRALAEEALTQIRDQAGGGSTRRIVPKK